MALNTFSDAEARHREEFLESEANGARSRETVTLDESQTILAGTVLGIVTASGEYAVYNDAETDGTQAAAAISLEAATTGSGETKEIAVIVRDAEVNGSELDWNGQAAPAIAAGTADLAALGVIVRTAP